MARVGGLALGFERGFCCRFFRRAMGYSANLTDRFLVRCHAIAGSFGPQFDSLCHHPVAARAFLVSWLRSTAWHCEIPILKSATLRGVDEGPLFTSGRRPHRGSSGASWSQSLKFFLCL